MPNFDIFSLLDIRRRNRRSRGKRKNGNLKRKLKNKFFWTLTDLWKILKSGRHQMLSKLSSLSIASLRKLDEEVIDFIDLPSIFRYNTVESSIPDYFESKEPPIICYKYNKPIRSTIFNFNKLVANLDIDTKTPDL